jgi:predicted ATPase/class 3 adenylate cyclase
MLTAAPPTGTVTFLFTDMEGSTRLWDEFPTVMNDVLARHDDLLGGVAEANDGYVFSRAGDGWGIAFASSADAVRAALEIQHKIADEDWPAPVGSIRLRMGLHAGIANQRDGDFFGTAVNRAARVSAAANGGQVFLTEAVRALIADDQATDWRLHDLGEHRLRDLTRSEHLWQIAAAGLDAPIADLAPRSRAGNLPAPGASIVGRDVEIDAVVSDLTVASVVTLVGVGGVGKTTLALEVARRLGHDGDEGSWFVDLTTVDDPDEVPSRIAAALGVARRGDMSDLDGLVDALATNAGIIVIDNAEHLIDRVAEVVDHITRRAPAVRLIITSREPLSIDGEVVHRIPPLDLSHGSGASPAATLFIDRALVAAPDLDRDAFPLDVVERICDRLDGLPLAIELAAANAETMTPAEILQALESESLALRSGSRSVSQRHRSLDDLIAWSYERLDPATQRVFARLSVFVGGCTAEAAEAVCGDETIGVGEVRTALRTLVRKSMITTDRGTGSTRFTMLETLRGYARHRCTELPGRAETEERHARWYASFSEEAFNGLSSPAEAKWMAVAIQELENLERAAMWAAAHEEFDVLGSVAVCLPTILESKSPPGIETWIELALDVLPPDHPGRFDYCFAAGYLTVFRGDLVGWEAVIDAGLAGLAHTERAKVMRDGFRLIAAFFLGDMDVVIADSEAASEAAHALGERRLAGSLVADLGLALFFTGEPERAWEVAEKLRTRAESSGVATSLAWSMYLLGELSSASDPMMALEYLEESVEYGLSIDNQFVVGISLIALASTASRNDQADVALDAIYRCVKLWHGTGNRPQFWTAIRNLVEILHLVGFDREALTLHLATEAASDQAPKLFGPYGDLYLSIATAIGDAVGDADRAAAAHRARRMDYHDTAMYALEVLTDVMSSRTVS